MTLETEDLLQSILIVWTVLIISVRMIYQISNYTWIR